MITTCIGSIVLVVTLKLVKVWFAGIVTLLGTTTVGSLLVKLTVIGVDDTALICTAPEQVSPAFNENKLNVILDKATVEEIGLMVSVAVFVTPPDTAEIVAVATAETFVVFTVNVAEEAPAATVTLAGTVAETLLLDRLTARAARRGFARQRDCACRGRAAGHAGRGQGERGKRGGSHRKRRRLGDAAVSRREGDAR